VWVAPTVTVCACSDSGYVCMVFYKRDSNVIELQQSEKYFENPDEACANFNPTTTPYTTLISKCGCCC
jgi:hypothetical protein